MEGIIEHQTSTLNFILTEKTRAQWQDSPELAPFLEPLDQLDGAPGLPDLTYLLKLMRLTCISHEEQSNRFFLLLESYCAIAEPPVLAEVLARFLLEGGEPFPSMTTKNEGWLAWALDYKPELARKGDMVKRLWRMAERRAEGIEKLAIQYIVTMLINKKQIEKEAQSRSQQDSARMDVDQDASFYPGRRSHDILYMLHCGPLADQYLPLWDDESVLNALVKLRDGSDQRALENQLLSLINVLDRFFSWIESQNHKESVEELKRRIASYTKAPELFMFAMDNILKYLDGRWIKNDTTEDNVSKPNMRATSLMAINKDREPIHYSASDSQGGYGFSESKNAIRGRPLRDKQVSKALDRGQSVRQFETADLVSQCIRGQDTGDVEQFLRRFLAHIGVRVDTAMVNVTAAASKHTAQQRDKILLRLISENAVYRSIMVSAIEQVHWTAASLCLPVIQTMLRCSIAHWSSCKNTSPRSYPKELEEAVWLAQLAEQTGLIPDPVNQATVLFPLVESRDVGLILEQCYYVLLVRNADAPAHPPLDSNSPEISLLRRLIFKHAASTFHLMPLFAGAGAGSAQA
ncbi:hypothetical protein BGZ98_007995 [Dissophora globulifera]|nr:hypothetical protein BGZ98_007995 [Dissophora globulifera]